MISGPLDLLIIQATPFCNLDCKYCYLPNRLDKQKISLTTVAKIFDRLIESDLIRDDFTLVWHAGEPLVMPLPFYKEVIELIRVKNTTKYKIRQNFQTNATLLDEEWCVFLLANKDTINISISLDGPAFIHNQQRINRKGEDTFSSVMKGIELLQNSQLRFGVISVITDNTLNHTKEFYSFFKNLKPKMLGLNVEEVEGANLFSSLYSGANNNERFTKFMNELYDLYVQDGRQLPIREFLQIEKFVLHGKSYKNKLGQQTTPYRIITIDINGNYSTLSPELLNTKSDDYGDFIIGNVFDNSFESALQTNKFNNIYSDVLEGVVMCKNQCGYYNVCGGGTPSNKYSEHKSFKVTTTNHCKYKFQWLFDTILSKIELETQTILDITTANIGSASSQNISNFDNER